MLYVSTFRNYRSYDQISTLRKRGSLVIRRLPLVLEVQVRFMHAVRQILVSEHAFSGVICRDDAR